jgi:hypothetical protein
MADYVIAGGTLLFLILSFFTWYHIGGADFFGINFSLKGFDRGGVKLAFFLFLLATIWSALPSFYDLTVGFPRSAVTVGLAALGFVLTLIAWLDTMDYDFSIWALLGLLTAAAILVVAALSLLPELRNRPALPGGLANAAQWANQPAPQYGQHGQPGPSQGGGTSGQPLPQQYAPPPAPPGHVPPPAPPPGGATAGSGPEVPSGA